MKSETGFDPALYDRFPTREERPPEEVEELERIWCAPKGWELLTAVNNNYIGFFYVANHSVPLALMDDVFATSAAFFAQDVETKREALYTAAGNRGYVPMKGEALDPTKPADLKEAFNIGLELPDDDPELVAGRMFRARNLWPSMPGFRETMLAYRRQR